MQRMISIVIPVYNAAEFLPEMLDSVLTQSFTDIEMILVNDGSTDCSGEICHRYAAQYNCVKVYDRENRGAATSRNFGLDQARGDFVWFMDSDDILAKNALQTAAAAQAKYGADVVIGGMNFCLTEENRILSKTIPNEIVFGARQFENYYEELFSANYVTSLCNKLIRRSLLIDNKIQMIEPLHMYEDYVFCMDFLLKSGTIVCIPAIVYYYQLRNAKSLSHRYKPDILNMFRLLQDRIAGYRAAFPHNGNADACLNNLMIYLAYECVKNEARCGGDPHGKIKKLLYDKDFHAAMVNYKSFGLKHRIVHTLMRRRSTAALLAYLKISGKGK